MSDIQGGGGSSPPAPIRPASILTRDTSQGLFPFEAFSFDPESAAAPVLTLNSPWTQAGTFTGTGTGLTNAISGTAAALASANPVLLSGQIGYETDTKYFKIGDGSTAYNSLSYQPQYGKVAPLPQGSSGVGYWEPISAGTGAALSLPAGGTWAYLVLGNQSSSNNLQGTFFAGVAAGGTQIYAAVAGYAPQAVVWRIA